MFSLRFNVTQQECIVKNEIHVREGGEKIILKRKYQQTTYD